MRSKQQEILLGLFVLIGLGVMVFLILFFRTVVDVGRGRYLITAEFENIYGMSPGTPVRLLGIDVGEIKKVSLTEDGLRAKVILSIDSDRRIRKDSGLRVRPQGILGDYYLEFSGGSADADFLRTDGKAVIEGETGSILDEVAADLSREVSGVGRKISDLVDNVNEIIGDRAFRENIRNTAANINKASVEAPETIKEVRLTAQRLKALSTDLQESIDRRGKDIEKLTKGVSKGVARMNEALESLNDILLRFRQGRGTVGALIGKDDLYEKLVKTVDETNATLAEMKELIVLIRENPSIFLWGR